jgi:hypothetical protein
VRQAPVGLPPDLIGGGLVVRLPVVIVRVLIGVEVLVGLGGGKLTCLADSSVGAICRIGQNNVRAIGGEDLFTLRRGIDGRQSVTGKPMAAPSMA